MGTKTGARHRTSRSQSALRAHYEAWVQKYGRVITYAQWLQPSMRMPIEIRAGSIADWARSK